MEGNHDKRRAARRSSLAGSPGSRAAVPPAARRRRDDATISWLDAGAAHAAIARPRYFTAAASTTRRRTSAPDPATGDRRASATARTSGSTSIDPVRFGGVGPASGFRARASARTGAHAGQAGDRLAGDRNEIAWKTCCVNCSHSFPPSFERQVWRMFAADTRAGVDRPDFRSSPALDSTVCARRSLARYPRARASAPGLK